MAHVALRDETSPGIVGLLQTFPDSARCLVALAEYLLRRDTPGLCMGEREVIAGYVSRLGQCAFCNLSHAGVGEALLGQPGLVETLACDPERADVRPVLRALLPIAAKVHRDPKTVTTADIARARAAGATDVEIHDAVLIAAAFCMYNRYVDGLGTAAPADRSAYEDGVTRTVERGYVDPLEDMLAALEEGAPQPE
jgi:uncharacterized peroxidase-related enzyme